MWQKWLEKAERRRACWAWAWDGSHSPITAIVKKKKQFFFVGGTTSGLGHSDQSILPLRDVSLTRSPCAERRVLVPTVVITIYLNPTSRRRSQPIFRPRYNDMTYIPQSASALRVMDKSKLGWRLRKYNIPMHDTWGPHTEATEIKNKIK